MRKFALYRDPPDFDDHLGVCLPLNGPHVYMVDPAGLGLNINPQIAGFDNFFYKKIKKSSFDPETVSGTIIFYDENTPKNAYLYYRQFVSFCTHAKKLYFGYAPYGDDNPEDISADTITYSGDGISFTPLVSDWVSFSDDGIYLAGGIPEYDYSSTLYKADAEFVSIEKSEITTTGVLACPAQFTLLTPWYDNSNTEVIPVNPSAVGTHYIYSEYLGEVTGDLPGSILFTLYTAMDKIEFGLKDHNTHNIIWSQILNRTTFYPDARDVVADLTYSSNPRDSIFNIILRDFSTPENPEEFNVLDYADITEDIYYKIPVGTDVDFYVDILGGSIGIPIVSEIQLFNYYRSV